MVQLPEKMESTETKTKSSITMAAIINRGFRDVQFQRCSVAEPTSFKLGSCPHTGFLKPLACPFILRPGSYIAPVFSPVQCDHEVGAAQGVHTYDYSKPHYTNIP